MKSLRVYINVFGNRQPGCINSFDPPPPLQNSAPYLGYYPGYVWEGPTEKANFLLRGESIARRKGGRKRFGKPPPEENYQRTS